MANVHRWGADDWIDRSEEVREERVKVKKKKKEKKKNSAGRGGGGGGDTWGREGGCSGMP